MTGNKMENADLHALIDLVIERIKMNNVDLHALIDLVIEQIKNDLELGDYTALVELLLSAPRANLISYLPEEETK